MDVQVANQNVLSAFDVVLVWVTSFDDNCIVVACDVQSFDEHVFYVCIDAVGVKAVPWDFEAGDGVPGINSDFKVVEIDVT